MKELDIGAMFESLKKVMDNFEDIADMGVNTVDREVAYEDWGIDVGWLSTMYVTDNPEAPYETAIKHKDYTERGQVGIFILENYNHFDKARKGHAKWKAVFEADILPAFIEDRASGLFGLMKVLDGRKIYRRKRD